MAFHQHVRLPRISPAFPTCSSVPVFQTHQWPPVTAGWTQKALTTQPLACGQYKTSSLGKFSHKTTCFVLEKDLDAVFSHGLLGKNVCDISQLRPPACWLFSLSVKPCHVATPTRSEGEWFDAGAVLKAQSARFTDRLGEKWSKVN